MKFNIKKIFFTAIKVFFSILIITAMFFYYLISSNNAYKGDYTSILKCKNKPFGKALLIFQPSQSSFTADISNQIARGINESGYEVTLTYPGKHLPEKIDEYGIILFGSPIYCGQISNPITESIKKYKNNYNDKKVILYSTGSNPREFTELDTMEIFLNGIKAYKKIKFIKNEKNVLENAYKTGIELSTGNKQQ